jgi:hypothetical protein
VPRDGEAGLEREEKELMQLLERRLTRRSLFRTSALGGAGVVGLALVGCGNPEDEEEPRSRAGQQTGDEPRHFALVDGWYRDLGVRYYDFGTNTPLTSGNAILSAPIYAFITGFDDEGAPQFVEGQHNIVDVLPGEEGYSDLWEVMLVTVPEDYTADTIRSAEDVAASGFEIVVPGLFVNCPIVPEGSTLETGLELTQGWYRDEAVFYPDYGFNPPVAIPIWPFITGFDDAGAPQFVEGQQNIIDSVPGDDGYSAFWRVNLVTVPEGYEANSIRSAEDVLASGFEITETDIVVNCPVTDVEEQEPATPTPTATATATQPEPTATQPAPTATPVPPTPTPTRAAPQPPETGSGNR